jgi:hypothetical protein
MTFGNASPNVMMQMASFRTNSTFCMGFISLYGVPLGFSSANVASLAGHCTPRRLTICCR